MRGGKMADRVKIGNKVIGENEPIYIIAEAGSNHNGDFDQAIKLIEAAADAKADAVKFQVFKASRMYPKTAGESDYLNLPKSIYDIISEMEMPFEWLPKLKKACAEKKIEFMSSVFDLESVEALDPFLNSFKIASYEMTHQPLLAAVGKTAKPVIVSTGASNMSEVARAVGHFYRTDNNSLVLMQCTAAYPAPLDSLNVRTIATMKEQFNIPVGFSDHSRDPLVGPMTAAAIGADVVEKHFTLSNDLPGPDHKFAVEPDELKLMIEKIRMVETALGSPKKRSGEIEQELRDFARRSIFSILDIEKGQVFSRANIDVLRSGKLMPGLEPARFAGIIGKKAKRFIKAETAIKEDDFE